MRTFLSRCSVHNTIHQQFEAGTDRSGWSVSLRVSGWPLAPYNCFQRKERRPRRHGHVSADLLNLYPELGVPYAGLA